MSKYDTYALYIIIVLTSDKSHNFADYLILTCALGHIGKDGVKAHETEFLHYQVPYLLSSPIYKFNTAQLIPQQINAYYQQQGEYPYERIKDLETHGYMLNIHQQIIMIDKNMHEGLILDSHIRFQPYINNNITILIHAKGVALAEIESPIHVSGRKKIENNDHTSTSATVTLHPDGLATATVMILCTTFLFIYKDSSSSSIYIHILLMQEQALPCIFTRINIWEIQVHPDHHHVSIKRKIICFFMEVTYLFLEVMWAVMRKLPMGRPRYLAIL
ncbi:hypothetical protein ACJX0J_008699 [Zea mays]